MTSRVLVTGAAGFIGSHTVDRLLATGCDVIGVDDLSTGSVSNLTAASTSDRFQFKAGDIAEATVLDSIIRDARPSAIVHLAALVSVPAAEDDPAKNYRINVEGTHRVAEAARKHAIRRVVFASSAAVYGESESLPLVEAGDVVPIGQYGSSKLIGEKLFASYAASYGISPVVFRYFNVFGPRQDPRSPYSGVVSVFAERYHAGEPVTVFGDGQQSRDFIYVGDLAKANASAATDLDIPAGVYNCCTGAQTSLLDLIDVLKGRYPEVGEPSFAEDRKGDIKHSLGDPSQAKDAFGFEATTPFGEGIGALLASFR